VRAASLLAQGGALLDAEAVLLIDHGQTEVCELDRLLQQGVRADGDVYLTAGDRFLHGGLFRRLEAACEERDAHGPLQVGRPQHDETVAGLPEPRAVRVRGGGARVEDAREGPHVLLGEDLGRGHDHALLARGDGGEQTGGGDDRLAAADVSLQQAGHRHGVGDVGEDLVDRLALRLRQFERQRLDAAASSESTGAPPASCHSRRRRTTPISIQSSSSKAKRRLAASASSSDCGACI